MNTKTPDKAKTERITVALDRKTRKALDDHRARIKDELGLEVGISEAAASLIRVGVRTS